MSSAGVGGLSAPPDGFSACYVVPHMLTQCLSHNFWPLFHDGQQHRESLDKYTKSVFDHNSPPGYSVVGYFLLSGQLSPTVRLVQPRHQGKGIVSLQEVV